MPWGIETIHPYLPSWGVERNLLASLSGGKGGLEGFRFIAGVDEDPLTLAFSAAYPFREIDRLFVLGVSGAGVDSLPFSLLKLTLGISRGVILSGGFRTGWSFLATRPQHPLLLTLSAMYYAPWDDPVALYFSDGSGTLTWGDSPALVLLDTWEEETYLRELKFDPTLPGYRFDPGGAGLPEGFFALLQRLCKAFSSPGEILWLLSLPHPSWAPRLKNILPGGDNILVSDFLKRGFLGPVDPLFLLADAAPRLKKGTRVAIVTYHSGITALLFKVESPLPVLPLRHPQPLHTATPYQWARFRGIERVYPPAPEEPLPLSTRELKPIFLRKGFRCQRCQTLTFPWAAQCISCGSQDGETQTLSWRGEVFTYTRDYLTPSLVPPTTMIVAEMESGGRIYLQGTDDLLHHVEIGMPVELSLRILHYGEEGKNPVYFWKLHGVP